MGELIVKVIVLIALLGGCMAFWVIMVNVVMVVYMAWKTRKDSVLDRQSHE